MAKLPTHDVTDSQINNVPKYFCVSSIITSTVFHFSGISVIIIKLTIYQNYPHKNTSCQQNKPTYFVYFLFHVVNKYKLCRLCLQVKHVVRYFSVKTP